MRNPTPLLALPLALLLVSCGHAGLKGRLQQVQAAKADARITGARQAQEYAVAVDAAYKAGDYRGRPDLGVAEATSVIATIDRALPTAGLDAPTLVAWRGMMFLDAGRMNEGFGELDRSFAMGPNELAGKILIDAHGLRNEPQIVGPLCARTAPVVRTDDDRLALIALCRKRMNALSPEGEMAWMSPELVAWYQGENARRLGARIDGDNARIERERQEQHVVHGMEECAASCKKEGLYCQNDCRRDHVCEDRCVEINHACLDRCEAHAHDRLGR